ncbi:hypothetical protein PHYBLDRAFT_63350 [Phycomyces blakesleeanus NRRL 1555(-)]|uniref:C2H2-type zinc finger transcription factor n=1 Tax=Phycomyces blakesleeanus (strain ATCC 8743b / DSM 1359 / FGSC 10004 / NBRC 33097 / NRRL 1555) TaxID=763407 RepID=A0A162TI05_PHYB8|nr:hypothetical protein PHYBLDRAFT_63350 [Phycomyces blakesleeanus NRRL 1555(-)]OAD68742.1 hypothetical protein PHYBLDRAFT_63350 [Phycomyces blakesleeanus NRRL 1555(-)]|eukprot:XP_018286782.1 hypothetical protein PHYBLDRAFT_63350 [Phycomyces blakesleeanus NRRL 1555(-)]
MAPICKPTIRKECQCSICKSKRLGFNHVSVKTFKCHQEKDNHDITHVQTPHEDICDTISSTVSEPEDIEMNSELRRAVILIVIINKILQFLFDPFRLPVSVAGLKHLVRFEALISGVNVVVVEVEEVFKRKN